MKRRHLITVVLLALVVLAAVATPYTWGRMKREAGYRSTLHSYSAVLKLGMSRQQVEDYLQSNGVSFGQVCCVEEHSAMSDVVKAGEEKAFSPLCSSEQVLITFEFAAREPHDALKLYPSDELKKIVLWRPMDCV